MNSSLGQIYPFPGREILQPDEILVRAIRLDDATPALADLQPRLTADEYERAARVMVKRQGLYFAMVRAELRELLSSILYIDPLLIRISYGPHGKPCVASLGRSPILKFNVSHTASMALIAAAWNREVGVDIEAVREWEAAGRISKRFFSPAENEALVAVPEDRRMRAFFACWTRKEAFVKALGGGLTIPLSGYTVNVDPDEPARLIEMQLDLKAAERWRLADLPVPPPYIACLAAEGHDWKIRFEEGNF